MATTKESSTASETIRPGLKVDLGEETRRRFDAILASTGETPAGLISKAIELFEAIIVAQGDGKCAGIAASDEVLETEFFGNGLALPPVIPALTSLQKPIEGPVAPPLRLDERGRLLPLTEEEKRQRREAFKSWLEQSKLMPNDPKESDEVFYRAMDETRPDRPLFKGLY